MTLYQLVALAYPLAIGILLVLAIGLAVRMMALQSQLAQAQLEIAGANNRLAQAKAQAALLSNTDPVTGLMVRQVVVERFQLSLGLARRQETVFGIVLLQLPGFDMMIDELGTEVGDRLLAAVAQRLRGATRETDTVGRVREYEFAALLPVLGGAEDIGPDASKLRAAMEPPFTLQGVPGTFSIKTFVGTATYPKDGEDWTTVLKAADESLSRSRILR
jgi:diguanylate cyclase (GGDEF)-like protein